MKRRRGLLLGVMFSVALAGLFAQPRRVLAQIAVGPQGGWTTRGPLGYGMIPAPSAYVVSIPASATNGASPAYNRVALQYYRALAAQQPLLLTTTNYPGIQGSWAEGLEPGAFAAASLLGRSSYFSGPTGASTSTALVPPPALPDTALIDVDVPIDADVRFDGVKTAQTGMHRSFITPALASGRSYTYTISVNWTVASQEVHKSRQVHVRAGDRVKIDFTANGAPTSRSVTGTPTP